MLGVPGLMEVYRGGRGQPGAGVADDKVYAYVPEMILLPQ